MKVDFANDKLEISEKSFSLNLVNPYFTFVIEVTIFWLFLQVPKIHVTLIITSTRLTKVVPKIESN